MAFRINIEPSFWGDPRYGQLCIEVGSVMMAGGQYLYALKLAQDYWCPKQQPIPRHVFEGAGLHQGLIKANIAREVDGGIYVEGTREAYEWYFIEREQLAALRSAGGKARASGAKRGPGGQFRPAGSSGHPAGSQQAGVVLAESPADDQPAGENGGVHQQRPAFSESESESVSDSYSEECTPPPENDAYPLVQKPGSKTAPLWEAYSRGFFNRYGTEPLRNATVNGQLANFLRRVPAADAPLVAAFYVEHPSEWYQRNGHAVGLMLKDSEKLWAEWKTGKKITTTGARKAEVDDESMTAMREFVRKKGLLHGGTE